VIAWYDVAFDELYPELYAHRNQAEAEAAITWLAGALETLGLGALRGRRVLDLGCGTGRHLRALAAHGAVPVGLDRSLPLLVRARASLPRTDLVAGDLRALPFRAGAFQGALSMFTSLGYFASEADHAAAFAGAAHALAPGAFLAVDYLNAEAVAAGPGPDSRRVVGEFEVEERRWIAAGGTRIEKEVTVRRRGAGEASEPVKHYVESVALWDRPELEGRLRRVGLEPRVAAGDYQGAPFGPRSPRLILLCERTGGGRA
jgi:SAM-dependent methyltransferase